mmetsp:Transcript_127325/g.330142  ORF Transcript_127325/g.330142 Transcript_127325/m.330142 type:complete len:161 (-) Transcript_127325:152-634(-)
MRIDLSASLSVMHPIVYGPSHGQPPPFTAAPTREPPALQTAPDIVDKCTDEMVEARREVQVPEFPEPRLMHKRDMQQMLVKHMSELNDSLHSWTGLLEKQVLELTQRFTSLHELSDAPGSASRSMPRGRERENIDQMLCGDKVEAKSSGPTLRFSPDVSR